MSEWKPVFIVREHEAVVSRRDLAALEPNLRVRVRADGRKFRTETEDLLRQSRKCWAGGLKTVGVVQPAVRAKNGE